MTDLLERPITRTAGARDAGSDRRDQDPQATVVALVAHAREVTSADREAFAERLAAAGATEAAIVVHTCHRVELYVAPAAWGDRPLPSAPGGARRLEDVSAARHLIEVACGLDSAVIGEDQILHQLRETLAERHATGQLDPVLDRLFQAALHAGRQAHTWFGGSHRSLADVALDVVEDRTGPLHGRWILVVGAGRMGRLAALAGQRRGARVIVSNRSNDRAETLAREVGGQTVDWGSVPLDAVPAGIVLAIGGEWQVDREGLAGLLAGSSVVVDLSSPAAIDASLRISLADRYTSIDALADAPEATIPDRLRRRLDRLVSETGRDYCQWLRSRENAPAIQAMAAAAEERRQTEMAWLLRRLPELDADERAIVEQMSHRLVASLFHAPYAALHADADGELERAARELFSL
jgi:glutamyl-tRNA reductase